MQRKQPTARNDLPAAPRRRRIRRRWWVVGLVSFVAVATGCGILADWWTCLPDDVQATFVGRQSCLECHQVETELWLGSDHDRAMDVATEATVLGDFNNAELTHHGIRSRMYREDGKFMIHTEGPDGALADFEVKYVFGVRPLQQYMVEFDRPPDMPAGEIARLQVLRVSWDTERGRWFYMPPPDVPHKLDPTDDLHWTGIAQRWNNMCAYCHSTNLQKNFDVQTGIYHTTFSEIDVSCEACHGPASVHVELANSRSLFWDRKRGYGLEKLKTPDPDVQIHSCAPCHSRRRVMYPDFRPGDDYYDFFSNELLEEATYYADGQIMDEDYVFGSFIQSKMYHKDIRCTDCHDPHSARLKHEGNRVCTSCHQHSGAKYDSPAHHHHEPDSTGALCVECHMPETTYMEVDPRRDHSIRIPRTDLSVQYGLPNACTRCHLTDTELPAEKTAAFQQYRDWLDAARDGDEQVRAELQRLDKWCDDAFREWYGAGQETEHFAPALVAGRQGAAGAAAQLAAIATNRRWPAIARATAIMQRGRLPEVPDFGPEREALDDPDPQVRMAAVDRYFERFPNIGSRPLSARERQMLSAQLGPLVRHLTPLLDDSHRNVRAETGRVLARLPGPLVSELLNGLQREKLDEAIDEYIAGVHESSDRGGAHLALGVLYESLGWDARAVESYRTAIRIEPRLAGPRSNLAALLERLLEQTARRAPGRPVPPRMRDYAEQIRQLRAAELELLARDARLLPDSAGIQYRYGLAAYLAGAQQDAEEALRRAVELEPGNDQFLLALVLFYEKYERFREARQAVARLIQLRPRDPVARDLQQRIENAGGAASGRD